MECIKQTKENWNKNETVSRDWESYPYIKKHVNFIVKTIEWYAYPQQVSNYIQGL